MGSGLAFALKPEIRRNALVFSLPIHAPEGEKVKVELFTLGGRRIGLYESMSKAGAGMCFL
ncbi:MAG: hypothetical protein ACLFQB_08150 [Chitinispirillaceae bacterium]